MFYVWLGIIILLLIVELLTIKLTTIWFVLSGILALLLTFVTDNFLIELGVFIIIGVLLLITSKPYFENLLQVHTDKKTANNMIGMIGIIVREVKKNQDGEVELDGKIWTASADKKITVGTPVDIIKIDGLKLVVEKRIDKENK